MPLFIHAVLCLFFIGMACWRLSRKLPFQAYSPVWMFILYYTPTTIIGFLTFKYTDWAEGMLGLSTVVTIPILEDAFVAQFWVIVFFAIGAVVGCVFVSGVDRGNMSAKEFLLNLRDELAAAMSQRKAHLLLIGSTIPVILLIIGVGPGALFERSVYLPLNSQVAKNLGYAFSPVANIILGYLAVSRLPIYMRILAVGLNLVFIAVFFGLTSRQSAVMAVVFVLGMLIGRPGSRGVYVASALWMGIAVNAMSSALYLRSAFHYQGLVPFTKFMLFNWSKIWMHPDGLPMLLFLFLYTFGVTTALTGYVMHAEPLLISDLLLCLNPLPGVMTRWYSVLEFYQLSPTVPYNSVGMLLNFGQAYANVYFLLAGMFFVRLDHRIRMFVNRGMVVRAGLVFGLAMMFTMMSSQYTLRAATRVIYYLIFFEALWVVLAYAARSRSRKTVPVSELP